MKISFCIILYNEEYLIYQQLANLYPHAHEIIAVVGRVLEFGDKLSIHLFLDIGIAILYANILTNKYVAAKTNNTFVCIY